MWFVLCEWQSCALCCVSGHWACLEAGLMFVSGSCCAYVSTKMRIYLYLHTYMCLSVCMYVFMYVCMHACMVHGYHTLRCHDAHMPSLSGSKHARARSPESHFFAVDASVSLALHPPLGCTISMLMSNAGTRT